MVVLVDDDDTFRSALAETLRDDGHDVVEFSAPSEVPPLDSLRGVGVLITDYDMPGTNGLMFADQFHVVHPDVPVVLVTACPTPHLQTQVAARSFLRMLPKPVEYGNLHDMLHSAAD